MGWTVMVLTALVFSLLTVILPVYADDTSIVEPSEKQIQQKNECLLTARKCGTSAISIQDKIELLTDEIAKGRAVYTREELDNLKQKLEEVNQTLDFLLNK